MSRCAHNVYPGCKGHFGVDPYRVRRQGPVPSPVDICQNARSTRTYEADRCYPRNGDVVGNEWCWRVCLLGMLDRRALENVLLPEIDLSQIETRPVSMAIDIPDEDFYGLTRAVREMTTAKGETAEILRLISFSHIALKKLSRRNRARACVQSREPTKTLYWPTSRS
jgi:hypothetical protein